MADTDVRGVALVVIEHLEKTVHAAHKDGRIVSEYVKAIQCTTC